MNCFNQKAQAGIKLLIGVGVTVTVILIAAVVMNNVNYQSNQNGDLNVNGIALNSNVNLNANINVNINSNSKERDAKRVSDIKQIQSSLELYYNNQVTPSYPADGVAGARGSSTIGALLSSVSESIPIASNLPETGCSNVQNIYIYTSYTDAVHHTDCDEEPCPYYTIGYCLGGTIAGIEAGSHNACERGIACET